MKSKKIQIQQWTNRLIFAVALVFLLTGLASAQETPAKTQGSIPVDWVHIQAVLDTKESYASSNSPAASLPPPEQDPCQHCHILGENTNIWAPISRWVWFGAFGTIFAFGIYRNIATWKRRVPWKPLAYQVGEWVDDRYKISEPLSKVLSKPVPRRALRWWYCLGGVTAFLFVVQAITGILLALYYKPTPEEAYTSIQYIENEIRFGAGIRAIHHWAANGMILMCFAHLLRVFIMGAYRPPRELNWLSGALLFFLTLGFGFTGYLLPWDQRAYWATTVGTDIGGGIPVIGELLLVFLRVGWNVTAFTLSRFYAFHIILLPIATLILMGMHFLMVRRQGIAEPL